MPALSGALQGLSLSDHVRHLQAGLHPAGQRGLRRLSGELPVLLRGLAGLHGLQPGLLPGRQLLQPLFEQLPAVLELSHHLQRLLARVLPVRLQLPSLWRHLPGLYGSRGLPYLRTEPYLPGLSHLHPQYLHHGPGVYGFSLRVQLLPGLPRPVHHLHRRGQPQQLPVLRGRLLPDQRHHLCPLQHQLQGL